MKHLLLSVACLLATLSGKAQDIAFRKKTVYVDGAECLQIKASDPNNISFLNRQGEELFFLKYATTRRGNLRYCKVIFLKERKSLTAANYMFLQKSLVKKLVESGTLKDCALVPEKVDEFILKYDEGVE